MAVEQWNHAVGELRKQVEQPGMVLKLMGDRLAGQREAQGEKLLKEVETTIKENLRMVHLKDTESNLK